MNRREFLLNAYKVGGIAALYSLGVTHAEAYSSGFLQAITQCTAGGGGGPNSYFYTGVNATTEPTWTTTKYQDNVSSGGSFITIGSTGGTLTKAGIKINGTSGITAIKIAVYNSTTLAVIASGTVNTPATGWNEITGLSGAISANQKVGVLIYSNATGDTVIPSLADATGAGAYTSGLYSAFPIDPGVLNTNYFLTDNAYAVRIFVQ